jgi:Lrp/AsnC family leucine-responsive transcriptional regulator
MKNSLENEIPLDGVDQRILNIFTTDGRISLSELAQKVSMSAPSVTERVRRLESKGILLGFTVDVDLSKLGYNLEAIVRIKPRPGKLKQVEAMIEDQPRFVSCDRVTGDDCYIAKLVLRTIDELDSLLEPFHDSAETNTSIVKSSLVKRRSVFS